MGAEVCSSVLGECAEKRGEWHSVVSHFQGKQVSYLQDFLDPLKCKQYWAFSWATLPLYLTPCIEHLGGCCSADCNWNLMLRTNDHWQEEVVCEGEVAG